MGKALVLILYGMGWGYVIHAKEIDKKVVRLARDAWEEYQRARTRIEASEIDRHVAIARIEKCYHDDVMEDLKTPEAELHAAG